MSTPDLQHMKAQTEGKLNYRYSVRGYDSADLIEAPKPGQSIGFLEVARLLSRADARRMCACWNACIGIDTAQLEAKPAAPAAAPLQQGEDLPPLPEPEINGTVYHEQHKICYSAPVHFTANQMRTYARTALANTRAAPNDSATAADYEEVLADHRRMVRMLDVAWNGEAGAAKQASLCDIVSQIVRERANTRAAAPAAEGASDE